MWTLWMMRGCFSIVPAEKRMMGGMLDHYLNHSSWSTVNTHMYVCVHVFVSMLYLTMCLVCDLYERGINADSLGSFIDLIAQKNMMDGSCEGRSTAFFLICAFQMIVNEIYFAWSVFAFISSGPFCLAVQKWFILQPVYMEKNFQTTSVFISRHLRGWRLYWVGWIFHRWLNILSLAPSVRNFSFMNCF